MSLSAVIPTHHRPHLVGEALDSVVDQTRQPDEIIVVDDADETATREVVEHVARRTPGIHIEYVASRRPGASASRNEGASRATGEIVAFLDDDDRWRPRFLEACTDRLAASPELDFVITWIAVTENGHELRYRCARPDLRPENFLLVNPGVLGSNLCVRRKALADIGGWDETLPNSQDLDLAIRLLRSGHRYGVVEHALLEHRRHPELPRISRVGDATTTGRRLFYEKNRDWPSAPRRFLFRLRTLTNQPLDDLSRTERAGRHLGRVLLRAQKDVVQVAMNRRHRRGSGQ